MIAAALRTAFLSIERFRLSHLLRSNEDLRNCHAGEKAFLFATGTSLVGMDLSKFNGQITIGCNDIFRHPSFSSFQLKYYVAGVPFRRWRQLSPRFTHAHHHQYFEAVNDAFRNRDTVHLYHATMHQYLKSRNLLSNVPRHYFLRKGALDKAEVQAVDLARPITFSEGGLTLMIALAMFMGCKEIYLFGCGYTYSPIQAFHFYDCMRCPAGLTKSEMDAAMESFGLSHPESNFQKTDTTIRNISDDELLVDFSANKSASECEDFYRTDRIIRSFAESNGFRILNVVPSGYSSQVYEKAPEEIASMEIRNGRDLNCIHNFSS